MVVAVVRHIHNTKPLKIYANQSNSYVKDSKPV